MIFFLKKGFVTFSNKKKSFHVWIPIDGKEGDDTLDQDEVGLGQRSRMEETGTKRG